MRLITALIVLLLCNTAYAEAQPPAQTPSVPETVALRWTNGTATVQLQRASAATLQTDGTILGVLLQWSNRRLQALLESDGDTLLSFTLSYPVTTANGTTRTLTQQGFYRELDPRIQQHMQAKNPRLDPAYVGTIAIRYVEKDPTYVEFFIENTRIAAPVLLTDPSDFWL